jgi:hypothetical protein
VEFSPFTPGGAIQDNAVASVFEPGPGDFRERLTFNRTLLTSSTVYPLGLSGCGEAVFSVFSTKGS